MGLILPNTAAVGNDCCLTPIEVEVPFIIVDNGHDSFWYPELLDKSSAGRMVFMMQQSNSITDADRIDIKLIPDATEIRTTKPNLGCIVSHPMRMELLGG